MDLPVQQPGYFPGYHDDGRVVQSGRRCSTVSIGDASPAANSLTATKLSTGSLERRFNKNESSEKSETIIQEVTYGGVLYPYADLAWHALVCTILLVLVRKFFGVLVGFEEYL